MDKPSENPACRRHNLVIHSDTAEIRHVQKLMIDELHAAGFSDEDIFAIRLSVEEAIINAMKHGNQLDHSKTVRVSFEIDDQAFLVRIGDEGNGFNPSDVPDPTLRENLEQPAGRGLLLMRHYMTEVKFLDNGNTVFMRRTRTTGHEARSQNPEARS